ncbi:hypothetical protein KIN20_028470 [Parelaphostrongylus tenuis]|uniref:Uncharacterized protein n=1 Tax=Parelaphostrongylus tenuis TaxID=148309 RepID=A0AAD5R0T1_PARTN|nr:hypothetical protein KIN20_028470 [Parelaphostrongylus tenuis]
MVLAVPNGAPLWAVPNATNSTFAQMTVTSAHPVPQMVMVVRWIADKVIAKVCVKLEKVLLEWAND